MASLFLSNQDNSKSNFNEDEELNFMIGQMLLTGFRGTELAEGNPVIEDIRKRHISGVILYEYDVPSASRPRNIQSPQQLKNLIASLKSIDTVPLFVVIDQEGGKVSRLKTIYGFPSTVSAQYLGDLDDANETRYQSNLIASSLKDLSININFAPVVDLNVNINCPVIAGIERSFSANPDIVIKHSGIFIEEHHKQNIFCVLKHFPGHGSSATDSHFGFVDITNRWTAAELLPYKNLIDSGYDDLIMPAHIFNSYLDSKYIATLSYNIITGLLRNELKWNGVVVSDDIMMAAITNYYGLETAIEKSINAGIDMLIFSNNSSVFDGDIIQKVLDIIKHLVKSGSVPRSRIEEAYRRIYRLKQRLK